MNWQHERLDRLLGLLRSESGSAGDLRGRVMSRLVASGVVRSGAGMAWRLAASLTAVVILAMGVELWLSQARSVDLGPSLRRGVDQLAPGAPVSGDQPARPPEVVAPAPRVARAPWRKT